MELFGSIFQSYSSSKAGNYFGTLRTLPKTCQMIEFLVDIIYMVHLVDCFPTGSWHSLSLTTGFFVFLIQSKDCVILEFRLSVPCLSVLVSTIGCY